MSAATPYSASSLDLTTRFNKGGIIASESDLVTYTLFDLEKMVVNAIHTFNDRYSVYLRCSDNIYEPNEVNYNLKYEGKRGCEGESADAAKNAEAVTVAYERLLQRVSAVETALGNLRSTGGITNEEYERRYNATITKYNEIVRVRTDLEEKMKDIAAVDEPSKRENRPYVSDVFIYHDATIYSSLALTVLATSLIYYAFVKM